MSGGGVCLYMCSSINFLPWLGLSVVQLENVCTEIRKLSSQPFIIATWCRPPYSTIDKFDQFETLLGKIDAENMEYQILGNINCNGRVSSLDHETKVLTGITEL